MPANDLQVDHEEGESSYCLSEGLNPMLPDQNPSSSDSRWSLAVRLGAVLAAGILLTFIGTNSGGNHPTNSDSGYRQLRQKQQPQSRIHSSIPQNQIGHRELKLLQRDYVDCSKYEFTMSITEKLRVNYVVNVDEKDPSKGVFSAEMIYQGEAWLGLAHSESGSMMGSMAILGLPDAPVAHQVQKYLLGSSTERNGIPQALPALQQTLLDTSLAQDGGNTIMRFTKLLSEPNEQTINPNWQNTFLFAYGSSNFLGYHEKRGVLALDLRPCTSTFREGDMRPSASMGRLQDLDGDEGQDRYEVTGNYVIQIGSEFDSETAGNDSSDMGEEETLEDIMQAGDAPTKIYPTQRPFSDDNIIQEPFNIDDDLVNFANPGNQTSRPQRSRKAKTIWMIHGLLATLTCGILLPFILASSILPGCFGGEKKKDQISGNQLFRWSNILLVVATIATFTTAIMAAAADNNTFTDKPTERLQTMSTDKSSSYHNPAGLGLCIIFLFFALAGGLRSFLNLTSKDNQDAVGVNNEGGTNDFSSVDVKSAKSVDKSLITLTWIFDNSHRLVGIILVFVSIWVCISGLETFGEWYEDTWFTAAVFWGISGPVLGGVGLLCVLQMVSYYHGLKHAPVDIDSYHHGFLHSVIAWFNGATNSPTGERYHGWESILGIQR